MKNTYLLLFASFLLISCSGIRNTRNHLNEIETFINARPDSALFLLDSLEISLPFNKSIRAHHALLHAQAKDKCFIDETNDSILLDVADYYRSKRDIPKLFKAYYYLGRIQYNAGNYSGAMLSYTKAEQLTDKTRDSFAKGLLYAQLGMLHQKYYDYSKALEAYRKAFKYYETAEMTNHLIYAKYSIAYVYREMRLFDKSVSLFSEVMSWGYDCNSAICQAAMENLIAIYDEIGNRKECIKLINSKYGLLFYDSPYINRAKALEMAMQGNAEALHIMQSHVWSNTNNCADTLSNYYYDVNINKSLGLYKEALVKQEKMYRIQDSLLSASLKYPLLSVKNQFLESEYRNAQLKIKSHKTQISLICIFSLIAVILIVLIFRKSMAAKNLEIARYVEAAEDLENALISKRQEVESILSEAGLVDKELNERVSFISNMLSKQYDLLNKLTSTYYETHGCNKDKEAIYKYVSKEIEKLSSDKESIRQLEDLVNIYKGNIMKVIRAELPHLTEMEYRLLCYLCAGFSAKAISIFTGDSTNNIYVKKSRIKNDILKLNGNSKELILSAINSQ